MAHLTTRGFNHLALSTTDMKKQLTFWCDVLGLPPGTVPPWGRASRPADRTAPGNVRARRHPDASARLAALPDQYVWDNLSETEPSVDVD